MNLDRLASVLAHDEGSRRDARGRHILYKCPADKWTVGYGRNVEDNGISEAEACQLLINDAIRATQDAAALVPNWLAIDDVRQGVLANMAFQLGKSRLSKFVKFLTAVNLHDYETAATEMRESQWFSQSGQRSARLVEEMRTGLEVR